jgi:hypothetical protein
MRHPVAVCAVLCLCATGASHAASPKEPAPARSLAALTDTYWYVPTGYLPALSYDPQAGTGAAISDQTVWRIRRSVDGYFWGDTVAVFSGDNAGMAGRAPVCNKMAGTLTPSGDVLMSFVNPDSRSSSVTTGFGHYKDEAGQKVFEMQMSTGQARMILHWAQMWKCTKGQECWTKLPGSELGLAAFVAQCDGTDRGARVKP